ncbi:MAG: ribonuclease P protein component [Candidatus Nomurabacteria bacterium]|jgi:ribonuclease P protein component|nr:ribonuclease P protein component [Candidatus Nomurabacteria bacterium]
MISKKYRFHGHGSLKYMFANGEQVRTKYFGLRFVRNSRRQAPRIAVIVSKKVFKSAVKRNRIRRRIFETIRLNFDFSKNIDFSITVFSPEVLMAPSAELTKQIKKVLAGIK